MSVLNKARKRTVACHVNMNALRQKSDYWFSWWLSNTSNSKWGWGWEVRLQKRHDSSSHTTYFDILSVVEIAWSGILVRCLYIELKIYWKQLFLIILLSTTMHHQFQEQKKVFLLHASDFPRTRILYTKTNVCKTE